MTPAERALITELLEQRARFQIGPLCADAASALMGLYAKLAERDATIARLREALELAYLSLLQIPVNSVLRVTSDRARAYCRDAIAVSTGQDSETVQNDFEARVALAKATT